MWMTGRPAARKASASSATFATTLWEVAWAGAPESAKAPPSMITSFWRSWMSSAARAPSSCRGWVSSLKGSPHVVQAVARHVRVDAVHRRARRDEQPVPRGTAPVDVPHVLGNLDHAEVLALRAEDPDALRAGDPDVAALVELHAVDELAALELAGADAIREHLAAAQAAVGLDVEDADVGAVGVVDVEQRLVGREAQAVGLDEVVDRQLQVAAARRDAVDALEIQVLLALDPEARHATVRRVGEVDRPVALDDDVVGAVELPAVVVAGQDLAPGAGPVG